VERAVKERMAVCGLRDVDSYLHRVRRSLGEMQELIEAIVVPETWFFRDREAFAALAKLVQGSELGPSLGGGLRILSVPCSSGEEPYTIAMTLQGCGLLPPSYRIDAVDISGRALALAETAVYGSNSFRGAELGFRDAYFTRSDKGWRLNDGTRAGVHFLQANILAPDFLPGAALYDIVFCRNLLIYFDRPTQERVVATLRRLLKPRGILFVGSSEPGLLIALGFVMEKLPQAYALRPPAESVTNVPPTVERKAAVRSPSARKQPVIAALPPAAVPSRPMQPKPAPPAPSPQRDELAQAMQLANQGRLREAGEICAAHVAAHGVSASSCHLMGLLSRAAGREQEAIAYFRKALYLDPQHAEAMSHLLLLLEKQGDDAQAQALRNRLRRLGDAAAHDRGEARR